MLARLKRLFTGAEKPAPVSAPPREPTPCIHDDFTDFGEGLRACKVDGCRQVQRFERAPVGNPDGLRWNWRPLARGEALGILKDYQERIRIPETFPDGCEERAA